MLEFIVFHTKLTSHSTIPDESVVLFNEVLLNEGDLLNSKIITVNQALRTYQITK